MLDLQDFPGQGTALVGILNAFMESKGLIEPGKWRQFCSETVPLVLMPKRTWTKWRDSYMRNSKLRITGRQDIIDATCCLHGSRFGRKDIGVERTA